MARPRKEGPKTQYGAIQIEKQALTLLTDRIRKAAPEALLSKFTIQALGLYLNLVESGRLHEAKALFIKKVED